MDKGRIIGVARRLRRDMTDAERRVWNLLRQPPFAEHRFRRQVPFDRYVADFASHSLRLIIEVDGSQHDAADPAEAARTRYLEGRGYRVLRFWNRDVLLNIEGVGGVVLDAMNGGLSRSPA
jgi:very-short-patch-repair endonuclease